MSKSHSDMAGKLIYTCIPSSPGCQHVTPPRGRISLRTDLIRYESQDSRSPKDCEAPDSARSGCSAAPAQAKAPMTKRWRRQPEPWMPPRPQECLCDRDRCKAYARGWNSILAVHPRALVPPRDRHNYVHLPTPRAVAALCDSMDQCTTQARGTTQHWARTSEQRPSALRGQIKQQKALHSQPRSHEVRGHAVRSPSGQIRGGPSPREPQHCRGWRERRRHVCEGAVGWRGPLNQAAPNQHTSQPFTARFAWPLLSWSW